MHKEKARLTNAVRRALFIFRSNANDTKCPQYRGNKNGKNTDRCYVTNDDREKPLLLKFAGQLNLLNHPTGLEEKANEDDSCKCHDRHDQAVVCYQI